MLERPEPHEALTRLSTHIEVRVCEASERTRFAFGRFHGPAYAGSDEAKTVPAVAC